MIQLNFTKDSDKGKDELVNLLYTTRVENSNLKEREKIVTDFINEVISIINEIKETKGLLRVFKIASLTVVLITVIEKFITKFNK